MRIYKLKFLVLIVGFAQMIYSFDNFDNNNVDWDILRQSKQWAPIIRSGPTILVASNITSIHDQNGEPVEVQLSNNNVGIGKVLFHIIVPSR